MLALRGISVTSSRIPARNIWMICSPGKFFATTNCTQIVYKKPAPLGGNIVLPQWECHRNSFSKKSVVKNPNFLNICKHSLSTESPITQKQLTMTSSSSGTSKTNTPNPPNPKASITNIEGNVTKTLHVNQKDPSSSSSCTPPSPPPSSHKSSTNDCKNDSDSVQMPDIKLPSREQVEKYFFRALIILWDAAVYLFAVAMKLTDQYILRNPTFKQYWNIFMQKMDNERKEMKK